MEDVSVLLARNVCRFGHDPIWLGGTVNVLAHHPTTGLKAIHRVAPYMPDIFWQSSSYWMLL